MADLYIDSIKTVNEMLMPSSTGALGQGSIKLIKTTITAQENDWEPIPDPVIDEIPLKAASNGVSSKLVGVEVGGTVIVASDLEVISAIPAKAYAEGDSMTIDGKAYAILSFQKIPAAGITSAVKFIVRG